MRVEIPHLLNTQAKLVVPEREHVCPPASIQQLQLLNTNKAVKVSHDVDIFLRPFRSRTSNDQ